MSKPSHNGAIDYLRGFAILIVLGIHFFDLRVKVNGQLNTFTHPIYQMFGHGYLGVTMFFVMSGFLITLTALKRGPGDQVSIDVATFYARRVTRILPLLVAAICVGLVFFTLGTPGDAAYDYILNMSPDIHTAPFWLSIVTFQYNWFKIYASLQGRYSGLQWDVLWSLAVEEQFYLLFPLLVVVARSATRIRYVMYGVIAVGTVLRVSLGVADVNVAVAGFASFTCFDAIAIGVLVALANPWTARRATLAAAAAVALLLLCYGLGGRPLAGLPIPGIAVATGLLIQASRSLDLSRLLRSAPRFAELGRLSYGAYLLHPLVYLSAAPLLTSLRLNPLLSFGLAVLFTYFVAKFSFETFERPVERVTRQRLYALIARRREPGAAKNAEARIAEAEMGGPG